MNDTATRCMNHVLGFAVDLDCQRAKVVVTPVLDGIECRTIRLDRWRLFYLWSSLLILMGIRKDRRRIWRIRLKEPSQAKKRRVHIGSLNGELFKFYDIKWQSGVDIHVQSVASVSHQNY